MTMVKVAEVETERRDTVSTDEGIRSRIVEVADKGLNDIESYFDGGDVEAARVGAAFKILGQATKILHMNQHRQLTERSQALRLLPWLADDSARAKYIKITNPKAAPLMLGKPSKTK